MKVEKLKRWWGWEDGSVMVEEWGCDGGRMGV